MLRGIPVIIQNTTVLDRYEPPPLSCLAVRQICVSRRPGGLFDDASHPWRPSPPRYNTIQYNTMPLASPQVLRGVSIVIASNLRKGGTTLLPTTRIVLQRGSASLFSSTAPAASATAAFSKSTTSSLATTSLCLTFALGLRQHYTVATTCTPAKPTAQLASTSFSAVHFKKSPHPSTQVGASITRSLRLLRRTVSLSIIFLPPLALLPILYFFPSSSLRATFLHSLKNSFVAAGPAFIKWGQWAAARPDIFPHDAVAIFSELHMSCPSHSFLHTVRTVEAAFHAPLHEIFESFTQQPMASGSIGQVHVATLTDSAAAACSVPPRTEVAVKVRHPGVAEMLDVDFELLFTAALLLMKIPSLSWMHLDESVGQFADVLFAQSNLGDEALKLTEFRRNFKDWSNVRFPEPLYPLVSEAVLVESLEVGVPVNHIADGRDTHADDSLFTSPSGVSTCRSITARLGLTAVLKMLLTDNLVHADLHPGNILVTERAEPRSPPYFWEKLFWRYYRGGYGPTPTMIFLDTGMTTSLSDRDKFGLLDMFRGVNDLNGEQCASAMIKLSRVSPSVDAEANEAAFRRDIITLFQGFVDEHGSQGSWRCFGDAIAGTIETLRQYERYVEGGVCTVMVTSMMLSDLQKRLDPGLHAMDVLKDVLGGVAVAEYVPILKGIADWWVASRSTKILGFTSRYYME